MIAAIAGSALLISAISPHPTAVQKSSVHFGPEAKYSGYLARPSGDGPFPAMVVIHEWWGLNDNIRNQAAKLAEAGYVALAVDLFGKSATDPQEAMKLVQGLDQSAATAQLLAATQYLRSQPFVRPDRIGSIGWCFGGAQSLNLAINDPKLAAAVIYYGKPITDPKELGKTHAAILGIYGEADESIPMDQVKAFEKALGEAKIEHEFHTYPDAGHAFANPSGGHRYKPDAAGDAWEKALVFLARIIHGRRE
jgi:carboxymethylenebutenolidase